MNRWIAVGEMTPGTAPQSFSGIYATGQTFIVGAPLQYASNELVECTDAADVATGIVGFSATAVNTGATADAANSPVVVQTSQGIYEGPTVVQFTSAKQNTYIGGIVAGTDTPVEPALSDIGVSYGLRRNTDGTWQVNRSDTTNDAVTITKIHPGIGGQVGFVTFQVLASVALQ